MDDRERAIERISDLMNIPEAEQILLLKIGELELMFREKVEEYRNLKNHFHKTQRDNMLIFKNKKPVKKLPTYSFELKRVEDKGSKSGHKWIISRIIPEPETPRNEVVPPEFFRVIDSWKPDATKIDSLTGFKSESLKKKFDITFTKCGKYHVMGKIRQNRRKNRKGIIEKDEKQAKLTFGDINPDHYEDYLELYRCMEANPLIRDNVFSFFNLVLRPKAGKVERIK